MRFVKRKSSTKKSGSLSEEQFERLKTNFFSERVKLHEFPSSLVTNLDRTGWKLVPTADYSMAAGRKQNSRDGETWRHKRQMSATFAASIME